MLQIAICEDMSGQFLSPYKGYLVNIKAVRSVEPNCMKLHGGLSVPIVRRNYRILIEQCFADGCGLCEFRM